MHAHSIATAAAFAGAVAATAAHPQQAAPGDEVICADREVIVERLDADFGESATGGGVINPERLLEIWSSPETGSWTALMSFADGTSCIVGSGMHWHQGTPPAVTAGTAM